jgi:hypothetical protein
MVNNHRYLLVFCFFIYSISFGQTKKFKVVDSSSEEFISSALVLFENHFVQPTDSIFTLDISNYTLSDTVQFTIFSKEYVRKKIRCTYNQIDTIYKLSPQVTDLTEVTVVESLNSADANRIDLGRLVLKLKDFQKIPQFLGETDPVKALQLLPGIQSSSDGSGIFVRGGGIDQNLLLLDDVPIYNISHLFGFFSVFNANSIEKMEIYKGTMPAMYGGRVSSVISLTSQTGNYNKWKGSTNIGILATSFNIDGPILKNKSSLQISFRRTYIDLLQKLLLSKSGNYSTNYFFYDGSFTFCHRFNSKTKLTISSFSGLDDFIYNDVNENSFKNSIKWGTNTLATKFYYNKSEKFSIVTTLGFVRYRMGFDAQIFNYKFQLNSSINDYIFKSVFKHNFKELGVLTYGFEQNYHSISPNNYQVNGGVTKISYSNDLNLRSTEFSFFANYDIKPLEKLKISLGLRMNNYLQLGPFKRYPLYTNGYNIDSISYTKNDVVSKYYFPEPRIAVEYTLNAKQSIKVGFSQNYQYLHLAPVSSVSLPTDVWIPSSSIIRPQKGSQLSAGYFRTILQAFEFSIEAYYKKMNNLIEYKDGVLSLLSTQLNYDENFYFGNGRSFGVEVFLRKNIGKWTGWFGYTLSKTERSFENIESGRWYPAKNDRRHDLSMVLNYELSSKWNISSVFVYKTGNALTIPLSRYFLAGTIVNTYSPKNSYRLPTYHRCDVSATYTYKKTETKEGSIIFSIYNLYARQNPFYIYFETSGNIDNYSIETKAKQVSLFTILPSISWRLVF